MAVGFNPVLGFYRVATPDDDDVAESYRCFNPVLGFYRVATFVRETSDADHGMFQSRAGFLPRRDRRVRRRTQHPQLRFNPVLGFYRVATSDVLRPETASECFNPVLGFYRVATRRAAIRVGFIQFQSRAGFLPRRDVKDSVLPTPLNNMFQSRAGFLPRRDGRVRLDCPRGRGSFNPVLGFYRVATPTPHAPSPHSHGFNPVLGFYRVATAVVFPGPNSIVFQSRAGFLPRRDRSGFPYARISICFNPVLGFYRVATRQ